MILGLIYVCKNKRDKKCAKIGYYFVFVFNPHFGAIKN